MCDNSVNCASLAHQLPSRGHRQGHTNCKGQASTRTRGLFSAPPASSPKLNEYILINHIVHILIWASTNTMQPKRQFTIFGLISLEPINFSSSICFLIMVIFQYWNFKEGSGGWWTPYRYSLRRSPTTPTITRGSRSDLVKKIFLGDYDKILFSNLYET